MRIALGADHAGVALKEHIKRQLDERGLFICHVVLASLVPLEMLVAGDRRFLQPGEPSQDSVGHLQPVSGEERIALLVCHMQRSEGPLGLQHRKFP